MGNRGGFDDKGHLTMHGAPRFVLGVYDSGGGYSSDPAQWEHQIFSPSGPRGLADTPINMYLNYHWGAVPIAQTRVLLDVLHRHGIMYLQTGNCFEKGGWRRPNLTAPFSIGSEPYVRAFAKHPAALGYYIMDECDDALIGETVEHNLQLHDWDPEGITFAANFMGPDKNPALWNDAADVMGIDPYPLYRAESSQGYPHFIVADFTSKLRAGAKPNRPVWAILQMFKGTTDARMPTPDEMRAHAVMAIVEGAQGIVFWEIGNGLRRGGTTEATAREYMGHLNVLMKELAALEPALLAPNMNQFLVNSTAFPDPVAGRIAQLQHNSAARPGENNDVDWRYANKVWYREEIAALQRGDHSKSGGFLTGAANIRTRASVANGQGYVFAYNYTNIRQQVKFKVPGYLSWSDTFGPYTARIYIISQAVDGSLSVRESKTGQTYPVSGA